MEETEITLQNIHKFVENAKAKNLPVDNKSEPIPTVNNGPVMKIAGKTYESIVLNNENDVLLKYYSPNCGYYRSFVNVYHKLTKKL